MILVHLVVDIQPPALCKVKRNRAIAVAFFGSFRGVYALPAGRVGTRQSPCDNQWQVSPENGFLGYEKGKYEGKYSKKPLF